MQTISDYNLSNNEPIGTNHFSSIVLSEDLKKLLVLNSLLKTAPPKGAMIIF